MGSAHAFWWTTGCEAALWAVAERVLDGASPKREAVLADCRLLLATRGAGMSAALAAYLLLLRAFAVLGYGVRLERLEPRRRDALLEALQSSPIQLVRMGFWGLRTLVFAAHYGRPGVGEPLGYRPVKDGNARLHAQA